MEGKYPLREKKNRNRRHQMQDRSGPNGPMNQVRSSLRFQAPQCCFGLLPSDWRLPLIAMLSSGDWGRSADLRVRRVSGKKWSSGSSSSLLSVLTLTKKSWMVANLRELPCDVVLGSQTLAALLKRSKITRSHHARPIPRRAGDRQRPGNLLVSTADDIEVILVPVE